MQGVFYFFLSCYGRAEKNQDKLLYSITYIKLNTTKLFNYPKPDNWVLLS